jgi:hypothetical protein
MLKFEHVKYLQNKDFTKNFFNPDSFTLFFSIIDASSSEFDLLRKSLKSQGLISQLMSISFLKNIINDFTLTKQFYKIFHGSLFISTYNPDNLSNFQVKLSLDSTFYYLIGNLYKNHLYYPSSVLKFNSLSTINTFSKLINFFFFKQSLLYFYISSIKKFFYLNV